MKKFYLLAILTALYSLTFGQKQLKDYQSVLNALKSGKTVTAVFHYGKCQLISDNMIEDKSPDAIGGMKLNAWEYFAAKAVRNKEAMIVASESVLIENPKGDGFVYNYVKLKITENNNVRVIAKYVDAKTMDVVMDESFYSTIANGSDTTSGMYFYSHE